jgi:hypothetical protein
MKNREKLYSRKELEEVFDRSRRWVAEVTKQVPDYGGRYDLGEVKARLQCGYKPFRRPERGED